MIQEVQLENGGDRCDKSLTGVKTLQCQLWKMIMEVNILSFFAVTGQTNIIHEECGVACLCLEHTPPNDAIL